MTQIGDDIVRCNATSVMLVNIDGKEDYVCTEHLTRLMREL